MRNYTIPLPPKLHTNGDHKPKVWFEMSRRHYWINDVEYDLPAGFLFPQDFAGFKYTVLQENILVTIFDTNDILVEHH